MKPKECKKEIAELVKRFGTRRKVASTLQITERYVYDLQNGEIPGKHLYLYITELAKNKTPKSKSPKPKGL